MCELYISKLSQKNNKKSYIGQYEKKTKICYIGEGQKATTEKYDSIYVKKEKTVRRIYKKLSATVTFG